MFQYRGSIETIFAKIIKLLFHRRLSWLVNQPDKVTRSINLDSDPLFDIGNINREKLLLSLRKDAVLSKNSFWDAQ